MIRRRLGTIAVVLGLGIGATTGAAFAGGTTDTDFSKLKPIKPPKSCEDIRGLTDDELEELDLVEESEDELEPPSELDDEPFELDDEPFFELFLTPRLSVL